MKKILTILTLFFISITLAACGPSQTQVKHKIDFDVNGGKETIESQWVIEGELAIEPNDPSRDGYTFEGWFTSEFAGESFKFTTTPIIRDISLQARWKKIDAPGALLVTFDLDYNTNEEVATQRLDIGDKVEQPARPKREGYTFAGWYNGYYLFDFETKLEDDLQLKALWRKNLELPEGDEIKIAFENYDESKAFIRVYNSFDRSGEMVTQNIDGSYTLEPGVYCYELRNLDDIYYVEYYKVLYISREKIFFSQTTNQALYIDAFEGLRTHNGSENHSPIALFNDEISGPDGFRGTNNLTSYNEIDKYETPALKRLEKGKTHQYTSIFEINDFLEELKNGNYAYSKYMHIYHSGYSEKNLFPIYTVLFTTANVSGLSLEEALAVANQDAINKQKARIMHVANVHGSEQTPTDGELAIIYQLTKGTYTDGTTSNIDNMEELFSRASFLIVPRLNVDGSHDVTRFQQTRQIDPNRDKLLIQAPENVAMAKLYEHFLADIVLDGHELVGNTSMRDSGIQRPDVQLGTKNAPTSGAEHSMYTNGQLLPYTLKALNDEGLIAMPYSSSNGSSTTGSQYFSLTGALNILIEVRGTALGLDTYPRRVYSYLVAAKALSDKVIMDAREFEYDDELLNRNYVVNKESDNWFDLTQTDSVLNMVQRRRDALIAGEVDLVLETSRSGLTRFIDPLDENGHGNTGRFYYDGTVSPISTIRVLSYHDTFVATRELPKGYFVDAEVFLGRSPLGANNTTLKEIFENHGIEFYYVSNLTNTLTAKQMKATGFDTYPRDTASSGALKTNIRVISAVEELSITTNFNNGAYYIPTNQLRGLLIAHLLEQDIFDNSTSGDDLAANRRNALHTSLFGAGFIKEDNNNLLPIYRYYGDDEVIPMIKSEIVVKIGESYKKADDVIYLNIGQQPTFDNMYLEYVENNQTKYEKVVSSMISRLDINKLGLQELRVTHPTNPSISSTCYVYVSNNLESENNIVYVRATGSDEQDGLTDITAVRTLKRAYEILIENNVSFESFIVVAGDFNYSEIHDVLPHHEFVITITSQLEKNGQIYDYRENDGVFNMYREIKLNGPTKFDNLIIRNSPVQVSRTIFAQGNQVEIGENVVTEASGDFYPSIVGGYETGIYEGNTFVIVKSGHWRNFFGGSYRGIIVGNVYVEIHGGTFSNMFYGGVYEMYDDAIHYNKVYVRGNVAINIYGGHFICGVYGGSNYGDIIGNTLIVVHGGIYERTLTPNSNRGSVSGEAVLENKR